jgi:uncharacterized membrane protein (UPF0182 family)
MLIESPRERIGLPVGGWARRLPLAWTLQLGGLVGPVPAGARLAWRLDPVERLAGLAPFAEWRHPTPVLVGGELVWLVHGYLAPEHFPLAPRTRWDRRESGSVRAGLLGVVHAERGDAQIYLRVADDPLADAWAEIAAGLVAPADSLPPAIRAVVPYPRDLFLAQRQALLAGLGGPRLGSAVPLGEESVATVWTRDTAGAALQAAFVRDATGDLSAVLVGTMRGGREAPRLELVDSIATMPTPSGLDDTWRRFPLSMQLAESVSAVKGQVVEGPIRLALGGPWVTAYQPVYGIDGDGRPALLAVNIASGSRVGAGRDVADAWQNLRGLRAPTPPGRRAADPLTEARRLMLEADSAMRAGDWARFGRAFEALRDALAGGAPR